MATKMINNDLQNTTQETEDWATSNPLKTRVNLDPVCYHKMYTKNTKQIYDKYYVFYTIFTQENTKLL
jgi:hypothetical protein